MSKAYYNENNPDAAAWLRELIKAGLIAPGHVDERSIEDVQPADLDGFTQCHFFAGIGVWSYALRCAGWHDDRPVWTGSCPCQPFSAAGKGGGFADERHLWPAFFHLIVQCRPGTVFGEQVASKDGLAWLDLVAADLEGAGYACGAVDTCAAGFGAPHIRQRLYWVAQRVDHTTGTRYEPARERSESETRDEARLRVSGEGRGDGGLADAAGGGSPHRGAGTIQPEPSASVRDTASRLADASSAGTGWDTRGVSGAKPTPRRGNGAASTCGPARGLAEPNGRSDSQGCTRERQQRLHQEGGNDLRFEGSPEWQEERNLRMPRPTDGHWRDADWLLCRDGKWRPVEPGTFPLAHGAPARVGRLRGYGNGLVAPQAEAFVRVYMETIGLQTRSGHLPLLATGGE